ncbi:MAG: trypsin-like serine protease [Deltaproteobacteria bacterium]|nr:trypsin-like serine protease [Deltaproteobacteria bacterium]
MLRRRHSYVPPALVLAIVGGAVISCNTEEGPGPVRTPEKVSVLQGAVQGGYADSTDTGVVGILIDTGGGNYASCTGSLLAPNVVLTARHCVSHLPGGNIVCGTTQFGTNYAASALLVYNDQTMTGSTFMYHVKEVRVPTANLMCGNDVAILILSQNFVSTKAKFITPAIDEPPYGGLGYSAVGYGITCPSCQDSGERNRRDSLSVNCVGACGQPQYAANQEWWGDDGVCSGDSGGPALDGQGRVIGVASRAGSQNGQCVGALYERVDSWKAMIVQAGLDGATQGGYAPPTWTGGGGGGSGGAPQTCDTCSNQSIVPGMPCETAWANCTGSNQCVAYLQCAQACAPNDSACGLKCYNDNLDGAHIYNQVWSCICTTGCPTPCATDCTEPQCGWNLTGTCNTCFHTNCCAEGQACADAQACTDLLYCLNGCAANDTACDNACTNKFSGAVNTFNTWMTCLKDKCGTECGFGTGGSGGAAGAGGSGGGAAGTGGGTAGTGGGTSGSGGGGIGGSGQGGSAQGGSGQGGASNGGSGGNPNQGGSSQGGSAGDPNNSDAGVANPLDVADSGGCGCATPGSSGMSGAGWLLVAAALTSLRRKRR